MTVGQVRAMSGNTAWDLPAAPVLEGGTVWGPAAAVLRAIGAYVKEDTDAGLLEAVSQVTAIAWRRDGGGLALTISATGPVRVEGHALRDPDRLAVDLANAVTRLRVPEDPHRAEGILRVRIAQFRVRPYVTRVVFDLARPLAFKITTGPGVVTVALGQSAAAAAAGAPATLPSPPPPGQAAQGAPQGAQSAQTKVRQGPAGEASQGPPGATAHGPGGSPTSPSTPSGSPDRDLREATGKSAADVSAHTAGPSPSSPPQSGDVAGPVAPEPLALPPLPEFLDAPGAFHVRGAAYDEQDGVGRLTIRASQPLAYTIHPFVYPDRLAIDITGGVFLSRRQDLEIGSDTVGNIVVSQLHLRPNLTRVLVHLNHRTSFTALTTDGGRSLVVMLGDSGRRLARGSAVIIDPGHGGADSGAIGPSGLHEADVTLGIGQMVKQALERQSVPAVLTRSDDSTVALEDRPDLAQRNGGVVFVSIHANAGQDPAAAGTETYYKTPESQALAAIVQAEVVQALGEPDRGIRTADFYVIVNTPMPSVLVETAFITNAREEELLRDLVVRRRVAEAIARAIVKFLAAERQATAP